MRFGASADRYPAARQGNCDRSGVAIEAPSDQHCVARSRWWITKAETVTLAVIEQNVPMLADAQALVGRFHAMIRRNAEMELEPWIDESKRSLIASFANGIANDKGAVHAAITQPWSNGQVEAQITKLKLVKRQMYGRAKLDLLQARLIGAP